MKQKNRKTRAMVSILVGSLLVAGPAMAANKALIVGVGHFQLSEINLPGIELDVTMAKELASYMGISQENIHVLADRDATQAKVKQEMTGWLTQGVSSNDRVFIYFSSHGTQVPDKNGDEEDGLDEAIVLHDAQRGSEDGLYIDDNFGEDIKHIPSQNVIVIVDACHSGTGTKSINWGGNSFNARKGKTKFVNLFNVSPKKKAYGVGSATDAGNSSSENYVSFAAAQDDELSVATPDKGSLFTVAFTDALKTERSNGSSYTLDAVFKSTQKILLDSGVDFHPAVGGNKEIASRPINVTDNHGGSVGNGPLWTNISSLVNGSLNIRVPAVAKEGEVINYEVDIPSEGYLNIIAVDPKDGGTVLFPNKFQTDNHVSAGKLMFPTPQMQFRITVEAPYGKTLVAAFLTKERVNLLEEGFGNRDSTGKSVKVFAHITSGGMRSLSGATKGARGFGLAGTKEEPAYWSGKAESETISASKGKQKSKGGKE